MAFAVLTMHRVARGDGDFDEPWSLAVDGRPVSSSTMALDHGEEPLAVEHLGSSFDRCEFVAARRVGGAVAWLSPASQPRGAWGPSLRVLGEVDVEPLFFEGAAYRHAIAPLVPDPAAAVAALPQLDLRESQQLLWIAAQRALGPWPPLAAGAWWEPSWPELLAQRTWAGCDPSRHALADLLLETSDAIERARVVEVVPERPAPACALMEGFMDRMGEPVVERLVATGSERAPAIWHPVGRGCWGRLSIAERPG